MRRRWQPYIAKYPWPHLRHFKKSEIGVMNHEKWQEERNYRRVRNEAGEVIANIITVDGMDVEVPEDVYLAYSQADRRERYITEEQSSGKLLSLEQMENDALLPDYVGAEADPFAGAAVTKGYRPGTHQRPVLRRRVYPGKRLIFPEHSIIIVDEAHRLPETAQQMLGVTLATKEIRNLILQLKGERYLLAAEMLEDSTGPLLCKLAQPREEAEPVEACLRLLTAPSCTLPIIQRQIGSVLSPLGSCQLNTVLDAVKLFTSSQTDMIFYTAEDVSTGGAMLCAAAGDITQRIKKILWQPDQAFVLTSGTMAVGRDFRRFKTQAGLEKGHRVMESVSPSPFDYRNNCLLYLPQIPPRQRAEDTDVYFNELTAELVGLINAASGHALVLFTSYAAMSAVKERLREESLPFPLLTLGRNAPHIIEQFRHTPGAVLLATGAAWEGFDFPGDCVSLLIIPRLPFAYPDARKERELEKYSSLRAFIREVAVPEMQIKLRQGFGRAIRTESDTCVIAILDERACRGRRYA